MIIENLRVPQMILDLAEAGIWPRTEAGANRQNLQSLVPPDRIKQFAPEEDRIFLLPLSSFRTVTRELISNARFWSKYGALQEIDTDLALIIADFGLGSDTAIVLDYRINISRPTVRRLKWESEDGRVFDGSRNHWVPCANDADEFVEMLGLEKQKP
jgi:hypothetical protein